MFADTRLKVVAVAATIALVGTGLAASKSSAATATASSAKGVAIYSATQAAAGSKDYATNCSSCHGANLEGGVGPALSGATLNTLAKNTHLSVGDMYTFISQQMPLNAPASLKPDQYVAIVSYILKYNGFPAGSKALTVKTATASKVQMHSDKT